MSGQSIIRRAYDTVALFALLNVAAVIGILAFLIGTGAIDGEKVSRAAAALRGELPVAEEGAVEGLQIAEDDPDKALEEGSVAELQMDIEIVRREAERIKEELRQRLALNNSILLRVATEREAFKTEREDAARQAQAEHAQRETKGFEKQVAIYESLSPKTAVQHLLGMEDTEEAAEMLLAMKTRKAKKIIEAAKGGDQTAQMMKILQRVREVAPARSAELTGE
ncbi:MAG: hypothetical protein JSU63_01030 [Phycisphaerales bacterium]|nr:MAG: hypothetical protein JSU63_01030 [Phycisphaerales bacterium]